MNNKSFGRLVRIFVIIGLSILFVVNFALFFAVVVILNIKVVQKSIFGKLPFKLEKKPWKKIELYEYLPNLELDVYYPKTERINGAILFAHGGGWISGYRRQPNNMSWYRYLLTEGFVVATIDYSRGYVAGIEKLIDEFLTAHKFLEENVPELFKDRKISYMGLSAGGHLALLAGFRNSENVGKIVSYYAPCDLMDIFDSYSIFANFSLRATTRRLPGKNEEIYKKYSPVNNIPENPPKVLLVHGMRDSVVPFKSSVKLFQKIKENGHFAELLVHKKADHGFEFVLKDELTKRILRKTVEFLKG